MTFEEASFFTNAASHAASEFAGKFDPRIRVLHADFNSDEEDNNCTIFHYKETIAISALMNCGVEARLAAALIGNDIVPLAQPVASHGDFETADGVHWRLQFDLPTYIKLDVEPFTVWALDESGAPHRLEHLNPTGETISSNRLPSDLSCRIKAACSNSLDLSDLAKLPIKEGHQALRARLTNAAAHLFKGRSDVGIRAASFPGEGRISIFDYEMNLCVAALIRMGWPTSLAAAVADQDYAFVAQVGGKVVFPPARPWNHPGANWEPVDLIDLKDGTQWAVFMADLGPIFDHDRYDVWSIRGKKGVIGNVSLPNGKPLYDPTRKTIRGEVKYRAFANRFSDDVN